MVKMGTSNRLTRRREGAERGRSAHMEIENLIRSTKRSVGLMEIEHLIRYPALAVGLKPSASQGKARLRGLFQTRLHPY